MSRHHRHRTRGKLQTPTTRAGSIHAHPGRVLLALVLLAIAVRAVCFVQMQQTVFLQLHKVDQTDMHYYDSWARQIAAGDWLSRSVRVPMHSWHQLIARAHLQEHPHAAGTPVVVAGPHADDAERLWAEWLETPRFYQDPLYPYLVAITYRVMGADVRYVFVWQLALGVIATALVWAVTRRYFGDGAALIAGMLALLAAPLLYYEMILLKESTIAFAGLLIVWLLDRAWTSGRWPAYLTLGLALGSATLLKSTFALFIVCAAAAVIWTYRREGRRLGVALGALLAGLIVAVSPLVIRNLAVGVSPLALGSTGPLTFAISNQPDYRPATGFSLDPARIARVVGQREADGLGVVLDTIGAHTPRTGARLLWQKFDRLWHWYEIPNNEDFYYVRLWVPILQWLPATFWVCAPLAWVGLVTTMRRARVTWPLLVLVGASIAPLLIFYVLGRFRTAVLAGLLPLAAAGLVQLVGWARAGAYRPALVAVAAVIGLAVWTGRPLPPGQSSIRPGDWMLPLVITYGRQAEEAAEADQPGRAADALLQFFRYEPSAEHFLAAGGRDLAAAFGPLHAECARLLRKAGRRAEAEAQERRAATLLGLSGDLAMER